MTPGPPLAGRVGIITGAGKGLGRAFAHDLAAAGARLIVNNRNRMVDASGRGPADHVVAQILASGGDAVAEHSDVADPGSARSMVDLALDRFGRLDFLVANAAVVDPQMLHKTTPERFDRVIATNLGGTVHLAAACSAQMRVAEFGRIVLVASTAGLHGEPTASAYTASKGAVIAFGRAIAVEGRRRNVLTNIILPFATTQMTDGGIDARFRDAMTAEAVAPVVTALVDPACTLNGQVLIAGGGALRAAGAVEFGTVALPGGPVTPDALTALIARSRRSPGREYADADTAFAEFASEAASAHCEPAAGTG